MTVTAQEEFSKVSNHEHCLINSTMQERNDVAYVEYKNLGVCVVNLLKYRDENPELIDQRGGAAVNSIDET